MAYQQQQQQQNRMEQDTYVIMEDAVHNATITRENGELRHQSKVHKHEHTEQQTDSMTIAAPNETRL